VTQAPWTLQGKVALITGATSGIGEACAHEMAGLGARILLAGRSAERGEQILAALQQQDCDAEFAAGDVRDAAYCERIVTAACDRFGRLDVLVNSAGVSFACSTIETTDAVWHETIDTNLTGLFFVSRAALRVMREQRSGSIVHVSSDWGLVGGRDAAAYCASKGGVVLLAKAMALDHARDGIRINAVCPGDTDTPMMQKDYDQRGVAHEQGEQEAGSGIPMGRMATAQEVARAICFLASDAASFITGAALPIDGGHTAV
jgi:meso-butanediol dehydrogenase / (S,S)-butanediol dehydrogenase / diacetyl reductase